MVSSQLPILIIGNGVAGITAARTLRKRTQKPIVVVSDEADYFFSRPALMYVFMGHMEWADIEPYESWFWDKNRIDLRFARVQHLEEGRALLSDGSTLPFESCIIATGSRPRASHWPGSDLRGVHTFVSKSDLEQLHEAATTCHNAVVIGGGLIGVEVAEMLKSRDINVTFLVREERYWSTVVPPRESEIIEQEIVRHGVQLCLAAEVRSIDGDESGRVRSVTTTCGHTFPADLVVRTIGVEPNTAVAVNSGIFVRRGVVVDDAFRTSMPNVFAIGDCCEFEDGAVEQLWYTARDHGEDVGNILTGLATSRRKRHFYNSAKFFDVEYQVFGKVSPAGGNEDVVLMPDDRHLLRIHVDGGVVRGFHSFGLRLRGEACLRMIDERSNIEDVLQRLSSIQFDAEFSQRITSHHRLYV